MIYVVSLKMIFLKEKAKENFNVWLLYLFDCSDHSECAKTMDDSVLF